MAHHSIVQKVMDELLTKDAIEPLTLHAGFHSNVFAVPPKCTGALLPIINLKQFNYHMHIPTFKMQTIKLVQKLIQQSDFAFFIDLMDVYLHILIVKHHHWFTVCLATHTLPVQGLPSDLATASRNFISLTRPFADVEIFMLLHFWIIFWLTQSMLARWHKPFCAI